MINNFLIISCIGNNDKLALRINKDFFIHKVERKKNEDKQLILEIKRFLDHNDVKLDQNFTVIVNANGYANCWCCSESECGSAYTKICT